MATSFAPGIDAKPLGLASSIRCKRREQETRSDLGTATTKTTRAHAYVLDQSPDMLREILEHRATAGMSWLEVAKVSEERTSSRDDRGEVGRGHLEDSVDLE
jgi:hypothetical protein